jgi:two-component system, cell cycle sensor histidine kinase and response regulator CckA
LGNIREAGQSANRLIQQLLAFSKSQTLPVTEIYPVVELSKLTPLLSSMVGRGINLVVEASERCPPLHLHGGQFEQLVLNLGTNAAHAMNSQGTLRIGLRVRHLDQGAITGLGAGEYVELSVADSGVGISPEILPHIFEPFHTTRSGAGGTGLGLATCYGIVTKHGGQILVDSQLGQGSTFRVLLPAVPAGQDATATAPLSKDEAIAQPDRGANGPRRSSGQSALVVDDDALVRAVATRMLVAEGYQVHDVGTFADAKQAIEDSSRHYDVIVTDVVLAPGLGTDLLRLARAARPQARCCAMSGFLPGPEVEAVLRQTGASFVAKPFDRSTLLAAVSNSPPASEPTSG